MDALCGALGRDRPPRLPPVPDDVKSVGVQTPANVQNPGGHLPELARRFPAVCAPRAAAHPRTGARAANASECARTADRPGATTTTTTTSAPPAPWPGACGDPNRDACSGPGDVGSYRAPRNAATSRRRRDTARASSFARGERRGARLGPRNTHTPRRPPFTAVRMLKSQLAAWRVRARRVRHFTDRARSQHQEKVVDGALNAYVACVASPPRGARGGGSTSRATSPASRQPTRRRQRQNFFPRRRRVR